MKSVRIASGKLRKDVKLLKEEIQNVQQIHNETRKELKELKEIVTKYKQQQEMKSDSTWKLGCNAERQQLNGLTSRIQCKD